MSSLTLSSFLLVLSLLHGSDVDSNALALVREAHRQTRQSIQTIEVTFSVIPLDLETSRPRQGQRIDVEWRQAGEAIRCLRRTGDVTTDQLWHDGEMKALETRKGKNNKLVRAGSLSSNKKTISIVTNPWVQGILRVPLQLDRVFDDALAERSRILELARVQQDGNTLYRARFSAPPVGGNQQAVEHEALFDPQHGFLVRKTRCSTAKYRQELDVLKFAEPKPGIFFPSEVELRVFNDDKLRSKTRVTFTSVRVNGVVDPSYFELHFPEGISVADHRKGLAYKTGAQEQPAGDVVALNTTPASNANVRRRFANNKMWITAGLGATVLIAGAGFLLWRRRKLARQ